MKKYPVIDILKTGQKIKNIMQSQGMTVQDIQNYLGFATSQSIYHWFAGRNMPSIDNLYALSELFGVPVDEMLTGSRKICFCFNKDLFWERAQMYYEKVQ